MTLFSRILWACNVRSQTGNKHDVQWRYLLVVEK